MRVAELNTTQIRALDRSKTVVMLTGGMLEEHGPYLPAYTDGILSDRLTQEIAQTVIAKKPGWTVLLFPQIPFGSTGSNDIGNQPSFPGTYTVRPSTLRAVFMDLASELGDQGFRWIMVVHVHGAPLHIRAIDDAGDFFHDTYGGRMINLWDLVPVISGWGNAMVKTMTDAEKREDGASLHGGMDEHSLILHLRPDLVAPGYKNCAGDHGTDRAGELRRGQASGLAGLHRIAAAGDGADGRADLECLRVGGERADAEDSRRRGSVGDPALRRHPREEPALPEGMDRPGEGARRGARRETTRVAAAETTVGGSMVRWMALALVFVLWQATGGEQYAGMWTGTYDGSGAGSFEMTSTRARTAR